MNHEKIVIPQSTPHNHPRLIGHEANPQIAFSTDPDIRGFLCLILPPLLGWFWVWAALRILIFIGMKQIPKWFLFGDPVNSRTTKML